MKYLLASTLLIMLLTSCGGSGEDNKKESSESTIPKVEARKAGDLKIAFYISDSLANNFDFYKEMEVSMNKKESVFQGKLKAMQNELEAYSAKQQKLLEQGLLTENQVLKVQESIQKKQQEIMQVQQVEGTKLQEETISISRALGNKVKAFGKEFCLANNIDILFQDAEVGQLTYISESFDVTKEFTAYVNAAENKLKKEISK